MFSLKYKNIIVGKIQPLCKDDLMWKTMYKVCYLCMYIVDIPSKLYYPKATFLYSVEQHSCLIQGFEFPVPATKIRWYLFLPWL